MNPHRIGMFSFLLYAHSVYVRNESGAARKAERSRIPMGIKRKPPRSKADKERQVMNRGGHYYDTAGLLESVNNEIKHITLQD